MLENSVTIDSISEIFGMKIKDLSDLVGVLLNKKDNKTYEYIHLKMSLEFQNNKSRTLKSFTSSFMYSFILFLIATFMLIFYLFGFMPIIEGMLIDFGLPLNTLYLQKVICSIFLVGIAVMVILLVMILAFYTVFPDICKLILLKKSKLCRILATSITLNQYAIAYGYSQSHDETIKTIKFLYSKGFINLQAQHIDSNVKKGNLIFQGHDSWMIDSYLSMITKGLDRIEVKSVVSSYQVLSQEQCEVIIKRYAAILKIIVIIFVGFVIYIFYSSLMMPLNAMEVL